MTQAFNPYHKWLGIPPEEQPANHYRLLGIAVFERDPDVIEAAADQRMTHLRNYQAGKHSELSQKLLNEVAAAKICLLNPQKRADYDASLREEIEARAVPSTPLPPMPLDPALAGLFPPVEPSSAAPLPFARKRRSVNPAVLGAIAIGGVLILGLVVWTASPSRENPAKPTVAIGTGEPTQPPPVQPQPTEPAKPTGTIQEGPSQPKTDEKPVEPTPSPPVQTMPIGPLDAATVRSLQERGAKEQGVPRETANSIGMKLVFVPAGEFEMGSPSSEIDRWLGQLIDKKVEWQRQLLPTETPRHRVKITKPLYLGAYEVTQAEYQQIIGRNPSAFSAGGQQKATVDSKDTSRHPVENVSWDDAMEFCRRLSDLPAEKNAGRVYRLPTEAEWEYACRAGTCTQWSCGDDPGALGEVAWFAGCNSGVTHPVGEKSPNALGAYDLHGNVTEWCMDRAGPDYYAYSPANDPEGISSGSARVLRGGGWWSEAVACRSAFRSSQPPMVRHYVQGFRVVCTPGRWGTPEGEPAAESSSPSRKKPVGRWTFDDPKNPGADSSGSACHGKVFEATYVPDGKAGGALSFQGKGGIDFDPSSLPKSLDLKEMSISWWGNVSPDCPAWSDWWAVAQSSQTWLVGELNGKCPEGQYGAPVLYGPGPVAGNSPNLLGAGWHHLVATMSGASGKMLLYCDGKELGALGRRHWFKGRVEKLAIGYAGTCRPDGKPSHVHSLIDDVQLYDYSLSPEDVQFLWTHPGLAIGDADPGPAPAPSPSQNQPASSSGGAIASPPKKQPLPSDEAQQKLLRQVDELYKLADAKTRLQKLKLARELLDLGQKPGSEPVERFVLLRRAMETASDGGDATLMLQAVDAIGAVFDIEPLAVKEKVLLKFAEESGDSTRIKSFVDATRGLIDRALAEDRYETALSLATAANRMCAKPAGKELRKAVYDRRLEIQALSDQWKKLEEARATLAKTPDDPSANLALGSWCCFEKDDWAKGLAYLAKGGDEPIKKLAAEELASPPKEVDSQLQLADAWWDLGESRKGRQKEAILLHAGSWYKEALPGVTGLIKAKVEKRLTEVARIGRPIPPLPPRQPSPAIAPFSAAEARQQQPSGGAKTVEERTTQISDDEPDATQRPARPGTRGPWIDLFQGVDPKRQSIHGDWRMEQGSLRQTNEYEARIILPPVVEGDYELEIAFTRDAGNQGIFLVLPVGVAACDLILNAWEGKASGLEYVDFRRANANATTTPPAPIVTGRKHVLAVQVRNEPNIARIEVDFDGRRYLRWSGDPKLLQPAIGIPEPYHIGLGAFGKTTFHAARIRPVGGRAKRTPARADHADGAASPVPGVMIARASYGSGGSQRDVTRLLQWLLERDSFSPVQADHALTGDPSSGWRKHLSVSYRLGNEQKSVGFQEWDVGTIPALPTEGLALPGASRTFKILAARYGAGLVWADVTPIVRKLVTDPKQPFEFGVRQFGLDPRENVRKSVVVWFDDHGKRYVRVFPEGKCVLLP